MSKEEGNVQTVDLKKLPLPALQQLNQQLEGELQHLQESITNFKSAQNRFSESLNVVSKPSQTDEGKEVLVPLTGSVYVPGKLTNPQKVLIDVGTGYYLEKSQGDAKDFFERKVKMMTSNMTKIQAVAQEKSKVVSVVNEVMREKIQQQLAAQQQQKAQ